MSTRPRVAVVADSSTSLPADLVERYAITLVPQRLVFQGRAYRDGIDLYSAQFYRMLKEAVEVAQPLGLTTYRS